MELIITSVLKDFHLISANIARSPLNFNYYRFFPRIRSFQLKLGIFFGIKINTFADKNILEIRNG